MDKKPITSSYVQLDLAASINEHEDGVQGGEPCHVPELQHTFAWMRGFVNGWYGWPSDGKTTYFDFMAVLKAKMDKWKWCLYKQEDMDSIIGPTGKVEIKANRIYKNLCWTMTGKTWNKNFAERSFVKQMTLEEEMEAMEFITKHFFVIYPKDRKYKNLIDQCRFMKEKYGIDGFLWDPWNAVELPDSERGDERLMRVFFELKEFALETNSVFNIINHARSMTDVKEKDGRYKVVNQFMQLGGSAWDIKMDGQYSIYRPERHLDPKDPKVHFYNLKQRQGEVVGVDRGSYEKIIFDRIKKQYYFDNVCPMTGHTKGEKATGNPFENVIDFSQAKEKESDSVPF